MSTAEATAPQAQPERLRLEIKRIPCVSKVRLSLCQGTHEVLALEYSQARATFSGNAFAWSEAFRPYGVTSFRLEEPEYELRRLMAQLFAFTPRSALTA